MLERINKTNDIKKLTLQEKQELASEIREYIIDVTSKNGGHLASNLGVVELTIALESVFDVSKDNIIWDVGHQSYTHKILTGRKEELKTIRKYKGLSGFPKTEESETDTFNTGHSSTSISAALGIATARDLKHKKQNVIAVIGDGALTGGMALEALNHLGSSKTRMIVILNDNEMSISENVGGMNDLLTDLRTRKNYRSINDKIRKGVEKIPVLGKIITKLVVGTKNVIKQMFVKGMYFEEIGIRYVGPVDGHNIEDLETLLSKVKELDGPTLVHVLTTKGKGYKPAESTPEKYHGVSPFEIETGESVSIKKDDYSKIFGNKLIKLASKNKNIVAITAAMSEGTGLSKFKEKYPDRLFDVGIAEQHALTFAAGLAKSGMIPFVSIYSSFYQRGYDQVIHDICTQKLPVIMCVDRAGLVGADGETHQGLFDMAFFKIVPNITIMAPKDFKELEAMMEFAVTLKKPVVIRYPRGGEEISFEKQTKIKLGTSEILETGKDYSVIAIGSKVSTGKQVVDKLKDMNKTCDLINVRFLKPLDNKTIINSISKTKKVIVIEDGTIIGGLSSSIKELIADNNLPIKYAKYYSYPDEFIKHGSIKELNKQYKVDVESIIKDIKR
jgi:1-deoxy-D-xylulose-5-phosphate synthase